MGAVHAAGYELMARKKVHPAWGLGETVVPSWLLYCHTSGSKRTGHSERDAMASLRSHPEAVWLMIVMLNDKLQQ